MGLKLALDTLDGLDEGTAKLYTKDEKSGKFHLGVDDFPDVTNLNKALKNERTAKDDAEKKYRDLAAQFDGIDPEVVRKIISDAEGNEEMKLIKEGKIEQVVTKRMERKAADYDKQLKAANDKATAATARVTRVNQRIADGLAKDAAAKAGMHGGGADDFARLLRADGWTLNDEDQLVLLDKDGTPVYGKNGKTALTIDEYAEGKRETHSHWWPATASGSGARQTTSSNGAGKTMRLAQFNALSAKDKAARMAEGLTLIE